MDLLAHWRVARMSRWAMWGSYHTPSAGAAPRSLGEMNPYGGEGPGLNVFEQLRANGAARTQSQPPPGDVGMGDDPAPTSDERSHRSGAQQKTGELSRAVRKDAKLKNKGGERIPQAASSSGDGNRPGSAND